MAKLRIRLSEGDGLGHAGPRVRYWHEIKVKEPKSKLRGRLRDKRTKPDEKGIPSAPVSMGDVVVKKAHWLGRMSRQEGAH